MIESSAVYVSKLDRIQAERLFERFYTGENAKNSTGLGLSIARLRMLSNYLKVPVVLMLHIRGVIHLWKRLKQS